MAVAVCMLLGLSGVQCVGDLVSPIGTSPTATLVPVSSLNYTVFIGDTVTMPTVRLEVDGREHVVQFTATVTQGNGTILEVLPDRRIAVKGYGDARVVVRPVSTALVTDTLRAEFMIHAAVESIRITGGDTLYAISDTLPLTATPVSPTGVPLTMAGLPAITWNVESGAGFVTLLDAAGTAQRVRSLANGTATIRAITDADTVLRSVVVAQRPESVSVRDSLTLVFTGQTYSLVDASFSIRDRLGTSVAGATAAWSTSNGGVATVSNSGLVTAQGPGTAFVVASVTPPGMPAVADTTAVVVEQAHIDIYSGDTQTDTAGTDLAAPFVVQLRRPNGDSLEIAGVPITFTVTGGGGLFGGQNQQVVPTDADGRAAATLTLGTLAGPNTATAAGAGLAGAAATFGATGVAGLATTLVTVSGSGQTQTVGTALANPFTVRVTDTNGNVVAGHAVAFKVTAGGGTFTLTGTDTAEVLTDAAGEAAITLTLGTVAGANGAEARAPGLTGSPHSYTATGTADAAARLAFVQQPTPQLAVAGNNVSTSVAVRDSFNNTVATNPTITLTLVQVVPGHLLGDTVEDASAGTAVFNNFSLDSAYAGYRLVATAPGLQPDTSMAFTVTPGAADNLGFRVQPLGAAAGQPFVPAIEVVVRDAFGNRLTGDNNRDITLSINTVPAGGSTILNGTPTVSTSGGIAAFTDVRIANAASGYRLRAATAGLTSATSTLFDVTGVPDTVVKISGDGQNGLVNQTLTNPFVVEVRDASGQPLVGDSVIFKVQTGGGLFGAIDSAIVLTNASGRASAVLTLGAAVGTNTATARSTKIASHVQTFSASASPAGLVLDFTVQPTNTTGGVPSTPAVQVAVKDGLGNVQTGSNAFITLSIESGTGTAGATILGTASVQAASGVATFTLAAVDLVGAGYRLRAQASGITAAVSNTFDVALGPPARLGLRSVPLTAEAGAPLASMQVEIQDLGGNFIATATNSVSVAILGGSGKAGANLRGTTTTAAVAGVATFADLSIDSAGTGYVLQASSSGLIVGNTPAFDIVPAPPVQMQIGTPGAAVAGAIMAPVVVELRDSLGNLATSATSTVSLTLGGPGVAAGATLLGTTAVNAAGGVATFSTLRIRRADAGYTLTAAATGLSDVATGPFTVNPAPSAKLAVVVQPVGGSPAVPLTPAIQVEVQDSIGNRRTAATDSIHVALAGGAVGAVLGGTVFHNAVNGVATFDDLTVDLEGSDYSLIATAAGLDTAITAAFNILPSGVSRLVITGMPAALEAGAPFALGVEVRDGAALVDTSTATVTLAITSGTGTTGAALRGTLVAQASGGVASFPGLSIDSAGTGYTITATAPALASGVSTALAIAPAPPSRLLFRVQPATRTAGNAFSPALEVVVLDSLFNHVTTATDLVALSIVPGTGDAGAALLGTTSLAAVGGVATFANVSIDSAGTGYQLLAGSGTLTPALSNTFSITVGPVATIAVSPDNLGLTTGGAGIQLSAVARDNVGNLIPGAVFTWTSLNTAVATVGGTGVATPVQSGHTAIAATSSGVTGYASAPVASVLPGSAINAWAGYTAPVTANFYGVWGSSDSDVWAVGSGGTIVHFNGASWSQVASPTGDQFEAVWGFGPNHVYALTIFGRIVRWNGTSWSSVLGNGTALMFGGAGADPDRHWTVGSGGRIELFDGAVRTQPASPTAEWLRGAWTMSRNFALAVGDNGAGALWLGTNWQAANLPVATTISAVHGTGLLEHAAAASDGGLYRYSGGAWNLIGQGEGGALGLHVLGRTEMYTSSIFGLIQRYNTIAGTVDSARVGAENLRAVWAAEGGNVWAVGDNVTLVRGVRGANLDVLPASPTITALTDTVRLAATITDANLLPVSGVGLTWTSRTPSIATVDTAGLVTAVANGPVWIVATGTGGVTDSTLVTVQQVAAIVTMSPSAILGTAAGPLPTVTPLSLDSLGNPILGRAYTNWSSFNTSVVTVNAATGDMTAVAPGQAVVRVRDNADFLSGFVTVTVAFSDAAGPINLLAAESSLTTQPLHGVSANVGADVIAVGDGGTVLRFDGTTWSTSTASTVENLTGVWSMGAIAYVSGANGTLLRGTAQNFNTVVNTNTSTFLLDVWGASPNDVYIVGGGGTILHTTQFDATNTTPMNSGTTESLNAVWGFGKDDVFAVGDNGTIVHWDGTQWLPMNSGTIQHLSAVWGTALNDVFASGAGNTLLRYDGINWNPLAGVSVSGYGIGGPASDQLMVVGEPPSLTLAYSGSGVSHHPTNLPTGGGAFLSGVAARGSQVFVVGSGGLVLRGHRAGQVALAPLTPTLTALGDTLRLTATATGSGGIVATVWAWLSTDANVVTVDSFGLVTAIGTGQANVCAMASGGITSCTAVTVAQAAGSVIVAPGGVSLTGSGATAQLVAEVRDGNGNVIPGAVVAWSSVAPAVAVVDTATGLVTAGQAGQAVITAVSGFVFGYATVTVSVPGATPVNLIDSLYLGTPVEAYGLWSAPGAFPVSVGYGAISHYTGGSWVTSNPGLTWFYDVWGFSGTNLFATDWNGNVFRSSDGVSWLADSTGVVNKQLNAIWGAAPNAIFAVGAQGTIVRYDGSVWAPMVSNTTAGLSAVWGTSATDVYAVGSGGTILHYDGTQWSPMASGTTGSLNDVWGASANDVFVVGQPGVALRLQGGAWVPMTLPAPVANNGIGAVDGTSASDVYASGDEGMLLRFDGSNWSVLAYPDSSGLFAWAITAAIGANHPDVLATSPRVGNPGWLYRGIRGGTLTLAPAAQTLTVGDTLNLIGTARDAVSVIVPGVRFTWVSLNPGVATVDTTGFVTAVGGGVADIVATAPGGVADTATISVGAPSGIALDGTSGYVAVPSAPTLDVNEITVEAWVRLATDVGNTQARIVQRQNPGNGAESWVLAVFGPGYLGSTGNELVFLTCNGATCSPFARGANLATNRWYHVAGTTDGVTQALLVDGEVVATTASVAAIGAIAGDLVIGAGVGPDFYFPGEIDEVRLFNAARTPAQILASRYTSLGAGTPNLIGAWGFNEGSGTTAIDLSGTGHDGTFTGGVTRTGNESWQTQAQVSSITVTPASPVFNAVLETQQLSATAFDAGATPIAGTVFAWSSSDTTVATVTTAGLVTAHGNGTANIFARSAGIGGSTQATGNIPVAIVVVTPAGVQLSGAGSQTTLTAEPRDAGGNVINNVIVAFNSLNGGVASVTNAGVVTSLMSGQTVIEATANGVTGDALVTVAYGSATPVTAWATVDASASNSITGLWTAPGERVFAVGSGGVLTSFDGAATWSALSPGLLNFGGVWGTSSNDLFTAGEDKVGRWTNNGADFSFTTVGTENLTGVWGASPRLAWVLGDAGSVRRYDGSNWQPDTVLSFVARSAWGFSRNDAIAVGDNGGISRFNGSVWADQSVGGPGLWAVWGPRPDDVYAVGVAGAIRHWDGLSWNVMTNPASSTLRSVWGPEEDDIYAVGDNGLILRFDGLQWDTAAVVTGAPQLNAVSGTRDGSVWVGGNAGLMLRGYRGATLQLSTLDTLTLVGLGSDTTLSAVIRDAQNNPIANVPYTWTTTNPAVADVDNNGVVYAVSAGSGLIIATARGGAADTTAVTVVDLAGIVILPTGVALGTAGATTTLTAEGRDPSNNPIPGLSFTWSSANSALASVDPATGLVTAVAAGQVFVSASLAGVIGHAVVTVGASQGNVANLYVPTPTGTAGGAPFYDIWGTSTGNVFAASFNQIRRWDGNAWTQSHTYRAEHLWSPSPFVVYAAGLDQVDRLVGAVWSNVIPTTGGPFLYRDIWGAGPNDLMIVGDNGSIVRYDSTQGTSPMLTPTAQGLAAIWGTSSSNVYAVGSGGTLLHYDGNPSNQWVAIGHPAGATDFTEIWGNSPTDIYVVGYNYTVLHYDGDSWGLVSIPVPPGYSGTAFLDAVWGSAGADVYVLSSEGALAHFNGLQWTATGLPRDAAFARYRGLFGVGGQVFVAGPDTVWIGHRNAAVNILNAPAGDITALQDTVDLDAQATAGGPVAGALFRWSSSNSAVVNVDSLTGVIVSQANGSANIIARSPGGAADTITITVQQVAGGISLSQAGVRLTTLSDVVDVSATAVDANGFPVNGVPLFCSSLLAGVATAAYNGAECQITAVASGQASVLVAGGGQTAYITTTVAIPGAVPVNLWALDSTGATQPFWDVWGASPTDVWAPGNEPHRYNGSTWSFSSFVGTAIWGFAANDIFAVAAGNIWHYDGNTWTQQASGLQAPLRGIWGSAPNDVFAVGGGSFIYHYDGTSWQPQASGTAQVLDGVWGFSRTEVYAVGGAGTVLKWDGANWAPFSSPSGGALYGVWGTSGSDLFVSGNFGWWRYDGNNWNTVLNTGSRYDLWGSSGSDVYAVGGSGQLEHYNGVSVTNQTVPTTQQLEGIWSQGAGEVLAVGWGGTILRGYRGASISFETSDTTFTALGDTLTLAIVARDAGFTPIPGVTYTWTSTDNGVAQVDTTGKITTVNNGVAQIIAEASGGLADTLTITVSQQVGGIVLSQTMVFLTGGITNITASPQDHNGNPMFGLPETWRSQNDVIASVVNGTVADQGIGGQTSVSVTIAGITAYATVTIQTTNVPAGAYNTSGNTGGLAVGDVWSSNGNNWYSVGQNGRSYRSFDGGQNFGNFIQLASSDMHGIWGLADTLIWAVGDNGNVLRWNGVFWNSITPPTNLPLYDVWAASPDYVVVVGANGLVVRYNGMVWDTLPQFTGATLRGVWGGGTGMIFVVGDFGTSAVWNGTNWSLMNGGGGNNLRGVHGWGASSQSIWAVGDNGTVLSFNGSLNWTDHTGSLPFGQYRSVWAGNSVHALIAGDNQVYRWDGFSFNPQSGTGSDSWNTVFGFGGSEVIAGIFEFKNRF